MDDIVRLAVVVVAIAVAPVLVLAMCAARRYLRQKPPEDLW